MEGKQRNNCCFTRCLVNDKMRSLVVDRKYWINMSSTTMVEKFWLSVAEYLEPHIYIFFIVSRIRSLNIWLMFSWRNKYECHSYLENMKLRFYLMWCLPKRGVCYSGFRGSNNVEQSMIDTSWRQSIEWRRTSSKCRKHLWDLEICVCTRIK